MFDFPKRAAKDRREAGPAPMGDQPFLLDRAPANPTARRWAERAWSCYPPAAILLAALLGGCGQLGLTSASADSPADARLAAGTVEPAPTSAPAPVAYPSDLPLIGTAAARAKVMHGKDRVELANLSQLPWGGGRLWLNRRYSRPLPYLLPGKIVRLDFAWFVDEKGEPFPSDNQDVFVERVELVLGDERTRVRFDLAY